MCRSMAPCMQRRHLHLTIVMSGPGRHAAGLVTEKAPLALEKFRAGAKDTEPSGIRAWQ